MSGRRSPLAERLEEAVAGCPDSLAAGTVTIDADLAREAVAALHAGHTAYRACMSAWSCGEPPHRVRDMLEAVEALGTTLCEPGAPAPKAAPVAPPEGSEG